MLHKFFDPSTPSMRKGCDGVATNVVASRPPERRLTGTTHARANFDDIRDSEDDFKQDNSTNIRRNYVLVQLEKKKRRSDILVVVLSYILCSE